MSFTDVFRKSLLSAGLKQAAFARAVNLSGAFINLVYHGTNKPPLDRIERWADVLHLAGDKRAEFISAAHAAHSPPDVRDVITSAALGLSTGSSYRDRLAQTDAPRITADAIGSDGRPWSIRAAETIADYRASGGPSLVGIVSAGDGGVDHYQGVEPAPFPLPPSWEVVQITGTSAYPVAYPGQFALIDTARATTPAQLDDATLIDLHDNLVLIQAQDGDQPLAFLKRFCHDDRAPGRYVIASVDSGRSSPYIPPDMILLIVPVVGIIFEDPRRPRRKGRAAARIEIP